MDISLAKRVWHYTTGGNCVTVFKEEFTLQGSLSKFHEQSSATIGKADVGRTTEG